MPASAIGRILDDDPELSQAVANGFGAILATLLAIHLGFTLVVLCALCLYLGAAWIRP